MKKSYRKFRDGKGRK